MYRIPYPKSTGIHANICPPSFCESVSVLSYYIKEFIKHDYEMITVIFGLMISYTDYDLLGHKIFYLVIYKSF